ncbi:hypothetical protein DFS34DRAFT_595054 [Phlyctochytrium arcticum]|nr:hypothetical protein DFS34DRAFT_595054 [Phlyctochytrium arcticum]
MRCTFGVGDVLNNYQAQCLPFGVNPQIVRDLACEHGDKVRVVATLPYRKLAILGRHDSTIRFSDSLFEIISEIARARGDGVTQMELSKKLDCDPRSLFYHVKTLSDMHYIVKFPIVHQGSSTNLCIHTRFLDKSTAYGNYMQKTRQLNKISSLNDALNPSTEANEGEQLELRKHPLLEVQGLEHVQHSELIKHKVTGILAAAADKLMTVPALINALRLDLSMSRRWFTRLMSNMQRTGYISVVRVCRADKKGVDRCIKLVNPYFPTDRIAGEGAVVPLRGSFQYRARQSTADPERKSILGEGGRKGVTAATLSASLNNIAPRVVHKILTRIMKGSETSSGSLGVTRLAEFIGRERRYRYFCFNPLPHQPHVTEPAEKALQSDSHISTIPEECINTETTDRHMDGKGVRENSRLADPPCIAVLTDPVSDLPVGNETPQLQSARRAPGTTLLASRGSDAEAVEFPQIGQPGAKGSPNFLVTAALRRSLLQELLAKHKILEINTLLMKAYQEKLMYLSDTLSAYKIDRRTLTRTAAALQNDGLLQILTVSIPHINGEPTTRRLLLDPSLDPKDPAVSAYVNMIADRVTLSGALGQQTRGVGLRDIPSRTAVDVQRTKGPGATTERALDDRSRRDHTDFWLTTAQQFGFVSAKMVRARLLHKWLYEFVENNTRAAARSQEMVDSPREMGWIFHTAMLFKDFTFDMYLKLIGQTSTTDAMEEHLNDERLRSLQIAELPLSIRISILGGRFRRQLKHLLDILETLHLVRPSSAERNSDDTTEITPDPFPLSYHLEQDVPLNDWTISAAPQLRVFNLNSLAVVDQYWSQLEYVCTRKSKRAHAFGESTSLDQPSRGALLRKEKLVLADLSNNRNWHSAYLYSKHQRRVLNAALEKQNEMDVEIDENSRQQLARELHLPLLQVVDFLKKRRQSKVEKSKLLRGKSDKWPQDLDPQSGIVGALAPGAIRPERMSQSFGRKHRRLRKEHSTADSKFSKILRLDSNLQYPPATSSSVEPQSQEPPHKVTKRTRLKWTSSDDDTLLHAHVIMRTCNATDRFDWTPIGGLLTSIPSSNSKVDELCRRRVRVLQKSIDFSARYHELVKIWTEVRGHYDQEHTSPSAQTDIAQMTAWFVDISRKMKRPSLECATHVDLPCEHAYLAKRFRILPATSRTAATLDDLGMMVDEKFSSRSKMSALYTSALSRNIKREETLNRPADVEGLSATTSDIEHGLVMAIIKVILVTPQDVYDPTLAFWMLHSYPQAAISLALSSLNARDCIVRVKSASDRRIPGKGFILSDKFLSTLAGVLPERLIPQANFYRSELLKSLRHGDQSFTPLISSGGSAALLDMIATKSLALSPALLKPSAMAGFGKIDQGDGYSSLGALNLCISLGKEQSESSRKRLNSDVYSAIPIPNKRAKMEDFGPYRENISTASVSEINSIFAHALRTASVVLNTKGMLGVSELEMKGILRDFGLSAEEIGSCLNMIGKASRLYASPDMPIFCVGFGATRYICREYLTCWNAPKSDLSKRDSILSSPPFGDQAENAILQSSPIGSLGLPSSEFSLPANGVAPADTASSQKRPNQAFVVAKLWFDIHGNELLAVKRACFEAVLGVIVQKPGIYQSKLFKRFECVMTRLELEEILCLLEESGACRKESFPLPCAIVGLQPNLDLARRSTFQSHNPSSTDCGRFIAIGRDDIASREVSCWWPNPDWYSKSVK